MLPDKKAPYARADERPRGRRLAVATAAELHVGTIGRERVRDEFLQTRSVWHYLNLAIEFCESG